MSCQCITSHNFAYGLLFIAFFGFFTYSNMTRTVWNNLQIIQTTIRLGPKTGRNFHFSIGGVCPINWKIPTIETSEYEDGDLKIPADDSGKLPEPVLVEPIYSNPVLKLRPDFFVLPILQNGPNNQLVGFRETIFLAIKLNRTVVLPKFFKHHHSM